MQGKIQKKEKGEGGKEREGGRRRGSGDRSPTETQDREKTF